MVMVIKRNKSRVGRFNSNNNNNNMSVKKGGTSGGGGGAEEFQNNVPSNNYCSSSSCSSLSVRVSPMDEWVRNLPPEVWTMILEYLKGDTNSLVNVTRTCSTWSDLLAKDKPNLLFPMVIPDLEKYLTGNDLLACRAVSTGWKAEADKILQSRVQESWWSPHFDDDLTNRVKHLEEVGGNSGSYRGRNVFHSAEQFDRFQEEMKNHPGNPFPSKSVIYQSLPNRDMIRAGQLNGRFQAWLSTFGSQISDFTYITRNWIIFVPDHVASVFRKLPNLSSFSLHHAHVDLYNDWTLPATMPELQHLKSLVLYDNGCLHSSRPCEIVVPFNVLLSSYGAQIECLEINSDLFFKLQYFRDDAITQNCGKLGSLKSLKIRNIPNYFCWRWLETKLLVLGLPQLQRISLHFNESERRDSSRGGGEMIQFRHLISLLNHWSSTLVEAHVLVELPQLQIYSPFSSGEDALRIRLNLEKELPSLKVFGVCYSLLLHTPVLSWVVKKFPNLERLEFHGFNGAQEVSNYQLPHSESESDDDEEEESRSKQGSSTPSPSASSSPPRCNHKEIRRRVGWLWDVVQSLQEVIVWDSVNSSYSPSKVFSWKRGEQSK